MGVDGAGFTVAGMFEGLTDAGLGFGIRHDERDKTKQRGRKRKRKQEREKGQRAKTQNAYK